MSRKGSWDFRDVSVGLKKLRDFLLGRKHNLHGRFPPEQASRTIPPPDIPRGPEDKYSNNYYYMRSAVRSIKPPVVAPIAEGPPLNQNPLMKAQPGCVRPDTVCFTCCPTPGLPWWWDGHCYYDIVPDPPSSPPCPCKSEPTEPAKS